MGRGSRDGTVMGLGFKPTFFSEKAKAVQHEDVSDLIASHVNQHLQVNNSDSSSTTTSESEGEEVVVVRKRLDVAEVIADLALDKEAREELRRRGRLSWSEKLDKKLSSDFVPVYPHKATSVRILSYNNFGTYYVAREDYSSGRGGSGRWSTERFVLFTVRDDSKHHVACKGTFCLSPRGPAHVPIGSPVIEEPFWEVRGDGDKVEKDVDGRGQICDVIKKGERKSKTGKLIVTIPGGHQVKMYDYDQASKMEKIMDPIWFNKKN